MALTEALVAAAEDDFEILEAPADSTERLRRYRIIGPDGKQELVTRAELEARRERRREAAEGRERAAQRRRLAALVVAAVPFFVVAVIVARTWLGAEEAGPSAPVVIAAAAPDVAPTPPAAKAPDVRAQATPEPEAPLAPKAEPESEVESELESDQPETRRGARTQAVATSPEDAAAAGGSQDVATAAAALTQPPAVGGLAPAPLRRTWSTPSPAESRLHRDARRAVERWLEAWRGQDVDVYLHSYTPEFARWGLSPVAWQRYRRNRIESVSWIEVEIDALRVETLASDRARIEFVQRYRDPGYADEVLKVLVAERQDGELLIVAEADRLLRRLPAE